MPSSRSSRKARLPREEDGDVGDGERLVVPKKAKLKGEIKPQRVKKPARKVKGKVMNEDNECADEPDGEELDEDDELAEEEHAAPQVEVKRRAVAAPRQRNNESSLPGDDDHQFVGDPVPENEARRLWPHRYLSKSAEVELRARRHYRHARVDGVVYHLNDDVYVKAEEGIADFIGRILEFFEGDDANNYFTCKWFFRAEDTVIRNVYSEGHDPRRVFMSEEKDDNVLGCIVSKVKIVQVKPDTDLEAKKNTIPECDLYYDMSYSVAYSTFANLELGTGVTSSGSSSISSDPSTATSKKSKNKRKANTSTKSRNASLLDIYSGCGAMSTGLCLGSQFYGLNLETRWAVDYNEFACQSLKLNHPHSEVRNEKAEDFLALIKEWKQLCDRFVFHKSDDRSSDTESSNSDDDIDADAIPDGEFEVEKFVGICYGDPCNIGEYGIKFKVRWKGYDESEDTWEPLSGLGKCDDKIREFVLEGYQRNILPLPHTVDVMCGGPPCQGISGFNRFRNYENPLKDEKNMQMLVFMNIVDFLKPKYVLMENVVDIVKFSNGHLGRYALSRLVSMNYQARLGMMVAGSYGLPQFRMRVFLWGALPTKVLPQYPLPTHDVVVRGGVPNEFEQNLVAYDEPSFKGLKKSLTLQDALTDLPEVGNDEKRDVRDYKVGPKNEFQRFIRQSRQEMNDFSFGNEKPKNEGKLFDHRPLKLNEDDYARVCRIPLKKGANFRDLPGVVVNSDNVVEIDTTVPRECLPSGKPLVPNYAIQFIRGKSLKPFGRLWWDETVPTVVGRAEPHNQIILHPGQHRVLTIRENARLQGFPDYYQLVGPVKQRYIQVGNAVAVPVARALGFALAQAFDGIGGGGSPIFTLPSTFTSLQPRVTVSDEAEAVSA